MTQTVKTSRGALAPSPPLPRGLIVLLGVAAAVVAVAGLRGAAGILGPLFLALMLTIAVHPLVGWVHRRASPCG